VVKKAFGMLGFIGQNIEYRSWDVLLKIKIKIKYFVVQYISKATLGILCTVLVTQLQKGYYYQERVQKRFTRMLPGLDGLSYKERLDRLGLFFLEHRRFRGDLIKVYQIMRGINKVDSQHVFTKGRGV